MLEVDTEDPEIMKDLVAMMRGDSPKLDYIHLFQRLLSALRDGPGFFNERLHPPKKIQHFVVILMRSDSGVVPNSHACKQGAS